MNTVTITSWGRLSFESEKKKKMGRFGFIKIFHLYIRDKPNEQVNNQLGRDICSYSTDERLRSSLDKKLFQP